MAGRRAIKAINWAPLIERVHEGEKSSLAAFKAKTDQYFRKVQENPESSPKIDWAYYRKNVSPALVDKFQKEYETLKIEYPVDKYSSQIDALEKEAMAEVKKFIEQSNQRIVEFETELKKLEGMMKYRDMTMEDFARHHPELAIDSINKPTIWPHTEEFQPGADEGKDKAHH